METERVHSPRTRTDCPWHACGTTSRVRNGKVLGDEERKLRAREAGQVFVSVNPRTSERLTEEPGAEE